MKTVLFPLVLAALLAACVTSPPPYAPSASVDVAGYSETRIESNRYFVTYRAPGGADAALLQDYALLRAADLTLQNDRDWFWVDRRTVDEQPASRGPSVGVGVGAGSWGRRSGASVGVGINLPIGQSGQRARGATLEVRLGDGPKPEAPNAYDARSVAASLRARLNTPR
ncbi:MAG: hypothetical protein K2P58_13725 [Hyphomonadaceae bacterium]|nr:hypothetical protein [Hyphomonadaceae bacterium]